MPADLSILTHRAISDKLNHEPGNVREKAEWWGLGTGGNHANGALYHCDVTAPPSSTCPSRSEAARPRPRPAPR